MKILYDKETDSIYLRFSDEKIVESEEKKEGVVVDYNDKDEIVAVEILNVKSDVREVDLPVIFKSAS